MEYNINGIPCLNLTNQGDENLIDWTNNINSTSDIIDVNSLPILRHLFLYNLNYLFKQWCGPIIYIVEYFARFTKTR